MTIIDRIIPIYVWFGWGFSTLGVFFSMINFGVAIITMITVKGIYVPLWMIPVIGVFIIALCTVTGYIAEKYAVWNRITSHMNQNANPEIKQLCADVAELRKDFKQLLKDK